MSIWQAIVIGLIQGLTEFLPISSSGHMILVGRLMNIEVGLGYGLAMHLATLLAVLIVLRKEVWSVARRPFSKSALLIVAATIPTVLIVLAFRGFFTAAFDGRWLGLSFLITAILLMAATLRISKKVQSSDSGIISGDTLKKAPIPTTYNPCLTQPNINPHINTAEKSGSKTEEPPKKLTKKLNFLDAVIIGIVQGFAALPGISRSGSTISTGILLGNEKQSIAKFSFLISIPIILGSSILELAGGGIGNITPIPLIFGFISAFISGYFAIKFMLKKLLLSFDIFVIYLLALSIFLFMDKLWLGWL